MRAFTKRSWLTALGVPLLSLAWAAGANAQANRPGTTGENPRPRGDLFPPPVYGYDDARQSLKITDEQLRRFRQAYGELDERYGREYGRLNDLDAGQRTLRTRELLGTYRTDALRTAGEILTPGQMNRYRQLELQQRGLAAFDDPEVSKRITLTAEQARRLRELGERYDRDMLDLRKAAGTDSAQALRRYDTLRGTTRQQLDTILTEAQRKAWQEMTGEPFTFRPDFLPADKGRDRPRP